MIMRYRYTCGILAMLMWLMTLPLSAMAETPAEAVMPSLTYTVTPATAQSIDALKKKAKKLCKRRCAITALDKGFLVTLRPNDTNPLMLPFETATDGKAYTHSVTTFWSGGKTHIAGNVFLTGLNRQCKAVTVTVDDSTGYAGKKDTKKVAAVFARARSVLDTRKAEAFARGEIITIGGKVLGDAPQKALAALLRAREAHNRGDITAALADVNAALNIRPAFAEALALRGRMYTQNMQLDKALKDYDAAIALKPAFVQALVWRANLSLEQGAIDAALKDCDTALTVKPGDNQALYLRSLCHAARNEWQPAYDDMSAALRGPQDYDPLALYLLGSAAVQLNMIDKAESWLTVLRKRFPDFAKTDELARRIRQAKTSTKDILPGLPLRKRK